ncbi:MAG TPA: aminotransferase class III-fold pyridoxal phosphate-dependent enzyme, partial [Saprospiraceae bacterium]|nr:aminotransferase class III-fold pyridoxal phosphate-dependent enzyme [Saprospiraceae bacterium]
CASSLATLQVIQEEELIAQVVQKTDAIQLIARHTKVSDVRIAGLWAAIELADSEAIMMVIQRLKEKGVLTDWFLFNDKSLRIAPPLNITMVELNTCMEMLLQILNSL